MLNPNATAQALEMISSQERARYDDSPPVRRETFLAGRLVLRRLAAELTGLAPAEVDLVAVCPDCGGPHGKPVIPGSGLHLSLSHSSDAVVAAASWDARVGVDLETGEHSARAIAAIGAITGDPTLASWTRVEATLKADGRGLRVDPRQVTVMPVADHLESSVVDRPDRYRLDDVELAPGILVSVAVARL